MSGQLSYGQAIILQAASEVDYLPFRAERQINLPHGVWRSLVLRDLLRPFTLGWVITMRGRALISGNPDIIESYRKERWRMNGKLPRYRVERTLDGWAVIDRHISKIRMHNDVVETYPCREAARIRTRELNILNKPTNEAAE